MNRQKLYDIFDKVYEKKFYDLDWDVWEKFLNDMGIETHNWPERMPRAMFSDMVNIISENKNCIAIHDPACEHSGYQEVFACMLVPSELAEKILVLGILPCTNNSDDVLS